MLKKQAVIIILQIARIYSKAIGKSTLLAVCSRDSLQVFAVCSVNSCLYAYFAFSQLWLPTVQEVLQADWQDVWHSPQPPFFMDSFKFLVVKVLMCFMPHILLHVLKIHTVGKEYISHAFCRQQETLFSIS